MKKRVDDISYLIGTLFAEFESKAKLLSYAFLYEKNELPIGDWASYHRQQLATLRQRLNGLLQAELPMINSALEKAVVLNFKSVQGKLKLVKELETLKKERIVPVEVPKVVFDRVNYFQDLVKNANETLISSVLLDHARKIQSIRTFTLANLPKEKKLYENIKQATEQGIVEQLKIPLSDGRQMNYKSYMEMSVRTSLQNDSADLQEFIGQQVGVVFYLCSSHADCADDHKGYQGKMYYDEKWRQFVKPEFYDVVGKHIQNKSMKSYQFIKGKPIYMATRPNCRHFFTPISVEQALGQSPNDLLTQLNVKKGNYKKEYYEALKQQRENERNIRKYKDRKELHEMQFEKAKTKEEKKLLQESIGRDNILVRKWQRANQLLTNKYKGVIFRDYDRENSKVVLNDLGVRYDLKLATQTNTANAG
jgi:hypothetical protein